MGNFIAENLLWLWIALFIILVIVNLINKFKPPIKFTKHHKSTRSIPVGLFSIAIALLAFVASAILGSGTKPNATSGELFFVGLVSGALNPIFFVGLPLGIYWLYQGAQQTSLHNNTGNDNTNSKLIPCPDCGRQISRLAISCPNCGRPLKSSNT